MLKRVLLPVAALRAAADETCVDLGRASRAALVDVNASALVDVNASARVDAVRRWLDGNGRPPSDWTVTSGRDLYSKTWKKIGGGNSKNAYKASFGGKTIIVKTRAHVGREDDESAHRADKAEEAVRGELLYLEDLRGRPGVPWLLGGWQIHGRVAYACSHGGDLLGSGGGTRGTTLPGDDWAKFAKDAPVAAARALLRCFKSFTDGGFFMSAAASEFQRGRAAGA